MVKGSRRPTTEAARVIVGSVVVEVKVKVKVKLKVKGSPT